MMKQKSLPIQKITFFLCTVLAIMQLSAQQTPELVFENPVLVSGTANTQGAIYRFNNVTSGVDAQIKLKKFSRPDITMLDVDLASLGWSKAFQPQFGLGGNVAPFQNWYIDFEVTFFQAGTNTKQKMKKFDLTSLDVDGDGLSISEYVIMNNANSVTFSTVSYLTGGGSGVQNFTCPVDDISSAVITCDQCNGTGITNSGSGTANECDKCEGSGKVYEQCEHPWAAETNIDGPVLNFLNIDTAATQVMATYSYLDKETFSFRIGAKSAAAVSNAGIRLNSKWYRSFSLAPPQGFTLPVRLVGFEAKYTKKEVDLNWTAAQEKQFDHFVIQRSSDGKNFKDIGVIFSDGSSDAIKNYTSTDRNLSKNGGTLYYRLKMVDGDKQITYSMVRIITLGEVKPNITLTSYPNPVVNQLRVTIPTVWQGKEVKFELFNGNGQNIKVQKTSNASQAETIAVADLSKGFYIVKATCDNEYAIQKISKN